MGDNKIKESEKKSGRFSIARDQNGIVVVTDKWTGNTVRPKCGEDAMASYSYFMGSFRSHGGEKAAQSFLESIACGGLPVTEMIHDAMEPQERLVSPRSCTCKRSVA